MKPAAGAPASPACGQLRRRCLLTVALPAVIWNNRLPGAIESHMRRLEVPPQAVALQPPDFRDIAKAYG